MWGHSSYTWTFRNRQIPTPKLICPVISNTSELQITKLIRRKTLFTSFSISFSQYLTNFPFFFFEKRNRWIYELWAVCFQRIKLFFSSYWVTKQIPISPALRERKRRFACHLWNLFENFKVRDKNFFLEKLFQEKILKRECFEKKIFLKFS